jgi:hypothetical protein
MPYPTHETNMANSQPLQPNSQTRVGHCQRDDVDVYIGRDRRDGELKHMNNTSIKVGGWLGNPYRLKDGYSREESAQLFEEDLKDRIESDPEFSDALIDLHGLVLGCWCQEVDEDEPSCHGEIIATHVDRLAAAEGETDV